MGGCSCSLSMFFPQMTALISFTFWSLLLRRSQALAKALKVNTTVRIISMKHNDIGTEGAKAWPVPGSNCFHGVSCFCNPLHAMPCLCQVFLTGGCSLNMLNSFCRNPNTCAIPNHCTCFFPVWVWSGEHSNSWSIEPYMHRTCMKHGPKTTVPLKPL